MIDRVIDTIYSAVGFPVLLFTMKVLAKFNQKIAIGLKMREPEGGIDPWLQLPPGTRPIWIHCASGEFEYAKPVIKRLKKISMTPILVTYFSPSIKKAVENFPGVDMSTPLPWDREEDWNRFFEHHQPRVLLIARTDTWPEMLKQARKHKVPSLLFSATLVSTSGRVKGISKILSKKVFSQLDQIYCVTEEDKKLFDQLGCADKTVVIGDTRYDQVIERLQNPKSISPLIVKTNVPTLVAGSTWPEDEQVLISALASLKNNLRAIVVPHEPHLDHVKDLERLCSSKGLSVERLSKLDEPWVSDVLVIDQTGILAELYSLGDIAFVGGSFKKTVHSVMEPLAAGCPTFVGPKHFNNREAILFQTIQAPNGLPSVIVANDAADLQKKFRLVIGLTSKSFAETKDFIRNQILQRGRKSEVVAAWVNDHLK